jgi:hypothetical protein
MRNDEFTNDLKMRNAALQIIYKWWMPCIEFENEEWRVYKWFPNEECRVTNNLQMMNAASVSRCCTRSAPCCARWTSRTPASPMPGSSSSAGASQTSPLSGSTPSGGVHWSIDLVVESLIDFWEGEWARFSVHLYAIISYEPCKIQNYFICIWSLVVSTFA